MGLMCGYMWGIGTTGTGRRWGDSFDTWGSGTIRMCDPHGEGCKEQKKKVCTLCGNFNGR